MHLLGKAKILFLLALAFMLVSNIACYAIETSVVAKDIKVPEISNFDEVSPQFYRGAVPSQKAIKELASQGIKTIIDLRLPGEASNKEELIANSLGLNYFHVPLGFFDPPSKKIDQVMQIVTDPKYQPVYIHCRHGADRTGALVGVYRMLVEGWSYDKTYSEMRQHHFKPWFLSLRRTVEHCQLASQVNVVNKTASSF